MPRDEDFFYALYIEDELEDENEKRYFENLRSFVSGTFKEFWDYYKNIAGIADQDFDESWIQWDVAESCAEAMTKIEQAEVNRPGRGFDAVFCDLQIPRTKSKRDEDKEYEHGIAVLEYLKHFSWPGAVIVVSAYAARPEVLAMREARAHLLCYDEWLCKIDDLVPEKRISTQAKLQRCLIPIEWMARYCRELKPPSIFINKHMRRLLRELTAVARRPAVEWPLTKVLLLGDPGAGKTRLAETFHQLLPKPGERGPRKEFITVNCASLVSEGHGGRQRLFGCENFGMGVKDQPGAFEAATCYSKMRKDNLATKGATIDFSRAGVVFLDEFVELSPDLQAAILNAIEEGVVYREGSGTKVRIGCHVVFATNASVQEITGGTKKTGSVTGGRLRLDLLDRIPYVFTVPSLSKRQDEIKEIIQEMAKGRLKSLGSELPASKPKVAITASALEVIRRGIRVKLIRSFRHLQMIADLVPGETTISDINLAPLLAKARILDIEQSIALPTEDLTFSNRAKILQLPGALWTNDVPEETDWAVKLLFGRYTEEEQVQPIDGISFPKHEHKVRFILLSRLIQPRERKRLYAETDGSLKQRRSRIAEELGLKLSDSRSKAEDEIISYLLNKPE